ncbi:MAG: hypothetical protein ACRBDL_05055 [Alphaproteobacteria bacterium]
MGWDIGRALGNAGEGIAEGFAHLGSVLAGGALKLAGVEAGDNHVISEIYRRYDTVMTPVMDYGVPIVSTAGEFVYETGAYAAAISPLGVAAHSYEVFSGDDLPDWAGGGLADRHRNVGEFVTFTVTEPSESLPYIGQGLANAGATFVGGAGDLVQGVWNIPTGTITGIYNLGMEDGKEVENPVYWGESAFDTIKAAEQLVHFVDVQDRIKNEEGDWIDNPHAGHQRALLYGSQGVGELATFWAGGWAVTAATKGSYVAIRGPQWAQKAIGSADEFKHADMARRTTEATQKVEQTAKQAETAKAHLASIQGAEGSTAEAIAHAEKALAQAEKQARGAERALEKVNQDAARQGVAQNNATTTAQTEQTTQGVNATASETAQTGAKTTTQNTTTATTATENSTAQVANGSNATVSSGAATGEAAQVTNVGKVTTADTTVQAANETTALITTRGQAFKEGAKVGAYQARHFYDPRYSPIIEGSAVVVAWQLGVHFDQKAAEQRRAQIESINTNDVTGGTKGVETDASREERLQKMIESGDAANSPQHTKPGFSDASANVARPNTLDSNFNDQSTNQVKQIPAEFMSFIPIQDQQTLEEVETSLDKTIKSL